MKLKKNDISDRVVQRLTNYLSILKEVRKYEEGINSIELSKIMDTTSAQVRKDLSTFGEFGVRGKGYDIEKLIEIIEEILGINKVNDVIIVGHGKMGEMITSNSKVLGKGFKIVGVFDKDKKKIGEKIPDLKMEIKKCGRSRRFYKKFFGSGRDSYIGSCKRSGSDCC
ncbi:redox-sensing transcriptional repressor Rex [Pseudoleptotrichia goodfellowii]|uniref:Putative DNA-binding protein domain protein n=1 Tax=Pseudoleptotrichia goodfellowii F0264 TaxID=596323 RepID=D0GMJ8_9FUSO|nr:redox-sensing transcriptional repressor Rex [Pseudoleptotrichia goodfellowii]EEY34684.1 putative DNA-binding protein domain protein [Pseudoleptotrichia goodfellowii F0264]